MLKETYLAQMKQTGKEKPDAVFIVVTRSAGHLLSPSWKLLNDYKDGHIDWAQYTERFRREMDCDSCIAQMKRIWDLSQTKEDQETYRQKVIGILQSTPWHVHRRS